MRGRGVISKLAGKAHVRFRPIADLADYPLQLIADHDRFALASVADLPTFAGLVRASVGQVALLYPRVHCGFLGDCMKLVLKIVGGLVALVLVVFLGLATYIYATALKPTKPVGFQSVVVPDPGHAPIAADIWYPTSAKPRFVLLGLTGERVAVDAAVLGEALPLIVFSHGTGGSGMSHADTALALAANGYVVVAPTHTGDNFQDDSDVGKPDWLLNRSRHLRRAIDMALGNWRDRRHIDPSRIGVFGFSAGATTALVTIGGQPDLRKIWSQCTVHPEFVCQLMPPKGLGSLQSYRNVQPQQWEADSRVRAAVIVAPGLGFTFAPSGLSKVRASVQLWAGSADQTVPFATNTGLIRTLLPQRPSVNMVRGAAHYSFLTPCLIGPPSICGDNRGFNRAAFHQRFNESVIQFFAANLSRHADASH